MVNMTNNEFRKVLKEKFVFVYSPKLMSYLRHRNCRYVCKSNHEVTGNPFWLYLRHPDVEEMMIKYRDSLYQDIPRLCKCKF